MYFWKGTTWALHLRDFLNRDISRASATSKMEHFVIIANDFQSLTIITKCSILDTEATVDPPLLKPIWQKRDEK